MAKMYKKFQDNTWNDNSKCDLYPLNERLLENILYGKHFEMKYNFQIYPD